MFWSLAPLVVACIALAGLVGMCSFAPSGPSTGNVPHYDAVGALNSDAQTLGFPVRMPRLPDGWHPNSGRRDGLDAGRTDPVTGQQVRAKVSTVGYLTNRGMYVSLTQSDADEDKLVRSIHPDMYPTGAQDVAGTKWIVYEGGGGDEAVWTTRLDSSGGATQIAVTGAGSPDEFRTLATATQSASPLPTTR
jgi:hypothetical protein